MKDTSSSMNLPCSFDFNLNRLLLNFGFIKIFLIKEFLSIFFKFKKMFFRVSYIYFGPILVFLFNSVKILVKLDICFKRFKIFFLCIFKSVLKYIFIWINYLFYHIISHAKRNSFFMVPYKNLVFLFKFIHEPNSLPKRMFNIWH
jgi:hypothetical protein